MKQAVTVGPHSIEIMDAPIPNPAPGEVLVRVERVGICGSDLHIFHGQHPRATFPRIQGHEASVRIVEIGGGYTGSLQVDDRVVIDPLLPCGTCYACRQGRGNCCPNVQVIGAHIDGLMQEFAVVPESALYAATSLSADLAALCEPLSIGVQAAHRAAIHTGEQVVVFGAGPIGAGVAIAAIDRGARVMAIERLASRLDHLMGLGAERAILAGESDIKEAVQEWTQGDGPAVTIDAVGTPSVIRQCCDLVAPAGRVVIVGLSKEEVSLPIADFTYKEMTILGTRGGVGRFPETLELLKRKSYLLVKLITHRFPLEEVQTALAFATDHAASSQKVMIEVWNASH
jgi:L-gulonate 5-dehydrogenase